MNATTPGPAPDKKQRQLTVRFEPEMGAWSLTERPAGPAGTVSLVLHDDVRLSADAATTELVELAVAVDDDGVVASAALEVVETLVGATPAALLEDGASIDDEHVVGFSPQPALSEAARLSRVRLLQSFDPTRHPLRGLDEVLHGHRLRRLPELADVAVRSAEAVWAPVISLARSCEDPTMLLAITPADRIELRTRVALARDLLAREHPTWVAHPAFALVDRFVEVLGEHQDAAATVYAAAFAAELGFPPGLLDTEREAARELVARSGDADAPETTEYQVTWQGRVDDFALRLGALIRVLHDGVVTAAGTVPGELVVRVPVEIGVEVEDLADIVVRVHTGAGELVGELVLTEVDTQRGLPAAQGRLHLPATVAGRPYDDIQVDLAQAGLPVPDADTVARMRRLRGLRAGQAAVAAETAGAHSLSAQYWNECAALLSGVDDANSAIALGHAQTAEARAGAGGDGGPGAQDWLTRVLKGWSGWARERLDDIRSTADEPEPVLEPEGRLRRLIEDLAGWNERSAELAEAHEELGRLLAIEPDAVNEAVDHLREAMRLYYRLNMAPQALACMTSLGEIDRRD